MAKSKKTKKTSALKSFFILVAVLAAVVAVGFWMTSNSASSHAESQWFNDVAAVASQKIDTSSPSMAVYCTTGESDSRNYVVVYKALSNYTVTEILGGKVAPVESQVVEGTQLAGTLVARDCADLTSKIVN